MGKHTDGILLVVRSFVTPKHPVRQLVSRIHNAHIPLVGVVLNNVDLPRRGYYYGYHYYGRNRYYYGTPDSDTAAAQPTGWQQVSAAFRRRSSRDPEGLERGGGKKT